MKNRRAHSRDLVENLARINPYSNKDLALVWATGYLAGILGRIMEEDPIRAREIERQFEDALRRRR